MPRRPWPIATPTECGSRRTWTDYAPSWNRRTCRSGGKAARGHMGSYITYGLRCWPSTVFATARADRVDRVGRPPILDAMVVQQEAPPHGKDQLGVMFGDEASDHVDQQLRQPGAGNFCGALEILLRLTI